MFLFPLVQCQQGRYTLFTVFGLYFLTHRVDDSTEETSEVTVQETLMSRHREDDGEAVVVVVVAAVAEVLKETIGITEMIGTEIGIEVDSETTISEDVDVGAVEDSATDSTTEEVDILALTRVPTQVLTQVPRGTSDPPCHLINLLHPMHLEDRIQQDPQVVVVAQ